MAKYKFEFEEDGLADILKKFKELKKEVDNLGKKAEKAVKKSGFDKSESGLIARTLGGVRKNKKTFDAITMGSVRASKQVTGLTKGVSGLSKTLGPWGMAIGKGADLISGFVSAVFDANKTVAEYNKRVYESVGGVGAFIETQGDLDSAQGKVTLGMAQMSDSMMNVGTNMDLMATSAERIAALDPFAKIGVKINAMAEMTTDATKSMGVMAIKFSRLWGVSVSEAASFTANFSYQTGRSADQVSKSLEQVTELALKSGISTSRFVATIESSTSEMGLFTVNMLASAKALKAFTKSAVPPKLAVETFDELSKAVGTMPKQMRALLASSPKTKKFIEESLGKKIEMFVDLERQGKLDPAGKAQLEALQNIKESVDKGEGLLAALNTEQFKAMVDAPTFLKIMNESLAEQFGANFALDKIQAKDIGIISEWVEKQYGISNKGLVSLITMAKTTEGGFEGLAKAMDDATKEQGEILKISDAIKVSTESSQKILQIVGEQMMFEIQKKLGLLAGPIATYTLKTLVAILEAIDFLTAGKSGVAGIAKSMNDALGKIGAAQKSAADEGLKQLDIAEKQVEKGSKAYEVLEDQRTQLELLQKMSGTMSETAHKDSKEFVEDLSKGFIDVVDAINPATYALQAMGAPRGPLGMIQLGIEKLGEKVGGMGGGGAAPSGMAAWGQSYAGMGGMLPRKADGGLVDKPTVAMVGEAGPEAIVPLKKGGGGGGFNINVNVSGLTGADKNVAKMIAEEVNAKLYDWLMRRRA